MTGRLILGKFGDGVTYGFRLSVPGVEVLTGGEEDMVLSSKWAGALSVHASGISSIGATVSFPTLSYIPLVMAISVTPASGKATGIPYWTEKNPESAYRTLFDYETRVASGCLFRVNTSSITFVAAKSGFTPHYSQVKYFVYRIPGT